MKSLLEITVLILHDCGMKCGANPFRDITTVTRRVKDEGESFLTITLPSLCKGFESALAEGRFSPALAPGFKAGRGRCLPRFLGGFTEKIFDADGVLLRDACVESIRAVRQICLVHSKLFEACNSRRQRVALAHFREVEDGIRTHGVHDRLLRCFDYVSKLSWTSILSGSPHGDPYEVLVPRHGPGKTANGVSGNGKYHFTEWPSRLERIFPISEFGCASIRSDSGFDTVRNCTYPDPRDERPVKVTLVPKSARKPRIIAIEPHFMQYMQQGLARWLVPLLEHRVGRRRLGSKDPGRRPWLGAGHVNFTDQRINQDLARAGSAYGRFSTLDLSDASDRVSCEHVFRMLRSVPIFRRYVFACRSTRASLPDGSTFPLRKFASMGSALCFPIESMFFFIVLVSGLMAESGGRLSPALAKRFARRIYVYGDDIIVPTEMAPLACNILETFGLKVNPDKSFWTGKFRESCGGVFYDGEDVSNVYLRRRMPASRTDVQEIVSAIAFSNQAYWLGLWGLARKMREELDKLLGALPCVSKQSQVLGWESFSNAHSHNGWSIDYQRPKLRGYIVTQPKQIDVLDDDAALLKCFGLIGVESTDPKHLRRSGRYGNLALKRRWT